MATRKTTNRRSTRTTVSRNADTGLVARTGRTIRNQPYTSAAIASGAIGAAAAALAGLFFLRRSDKSLGEMTDGLTSRVKDGLADASNRAKDTVARLRDGLDHDKSQAEIAEEALTLKETGRKSKGPRGPIAQQDIKSGLAVH